MKLENIGNSPKKKRVIEPSYDKNNNIRKLREVPGLGGFVAMLSDEELREELDNQDRKKIPSTLEREYKTPKFLKGKHVGDLGSHIKSNYNNESIDVGKRTDLEDGDKSKQETIKKISRAIESSEN